MDGTTAWDKDCHHPLIFDIFYPKVSVFRTNHNLSSILEIARLNGDTFCPLEILYVIIYSFFFHQLYFDDSSLNLHCQVQLRRLEKAGLGGGGKRSRNSDRKWKLAFLTELPVSLPWKDAGLNET